MPVIGVVRVGPHIMADRYTYVPLIGLFIMIAWGFPDLVSRWPHRNVVLATSSAVVLSILVTRSWFQVRHWETSITLCKHTLKVTSNNVRAHNNLANALADQGRLSEAVFHYSEALRMKPDSAKLHYNLGIVMLKLKRLDEAAAHFMGALRISPNSSEAHNNLGTALLRQGRLKEAAEHFGEALRLRPSLTEAQSNLQLTLRLMGESPPASQAMPEP
jgi:tetratricopeptide (TPR) repeat protein